MKFRFFNLFDFFRMRSDKNASQVEGSYPEPGNSNESQDSIECTESSVEIEHIIGTNVSLPSVEYTIQKTNSTEHKKNKPSILIGCHVVSQVQPLNTKRNRFKGIAGRCCYCYDSYIPLVQAGKMNLLDAERLSLVCSDCAKITTLGNLVCPKHCVPMQISQNQMVYIDPQTIEEREKNKPVKIIFQALVWLFTEEQKEK
jgi:hypothetical protein